MIDPATLAELLPDYLPRQRWFGAADREIASVEITASEVFRKEWPALHWYLAEVAFRDDGDPACYQLFVGARPVDPAPDFLHGKEKVTLGVVEIEGEPVTVYDAIVDSELALAVLNIIAPDEDVHLVRPLTVEQSNSSIVYDERLILKLFRRVRPGPNPDVEVTQKLFETGFTHVSAPVAEWRRDGTDLGVLRGYLVGATEGLSLAHTSLRDMYGSRLPPGDTGGDFAPEAGRLGQITAEMHLALADAFGAEAADTASWVADMRAQLARVPRAAGLDAGRVGKVYDRLAAIDESGCAIRVHGDYHLGQTMRADGGWYVLDFEGEPARPIDERVRPSSPLRDVAGMLRSFHYAARTALAEWGDDVDDELVDLSHQWEDRVVDAYSEGYFSTEGIDALLPPEGRPRDVVAGAFELDKAVYEVAYELSHRPDWVGIPLEAVNRILEKLPSS